MSFWDSGAPAMMVIEVAGCNFHWQMVNDWRQWKWQLYSGYHGCHCWRCHQHCRTECWWRVKPWWSNSNGGAGLAVKQRSEVIIVLRCRWLDTNGSGGGKWQLLWRWRQREVELGLQSVRLDFVWLKDHLDRTSYRVLRRMAGTQPWWGDPAIVTHDFSTTCLDYCNIFVTMKRYFLLKM